MAFLPPPTSALTAAVLIMEEEEEEEGLSTRGIKIILRYLRRRRTKLLGLHTVACFRTSQDKVLTRWGVGGRKEKRRERSFGILRPHPFLSPLFYRGRPQYDNGSAHDEGGKYLWRSHALTVSR